MFKQKSLFAKFLIPTLTVVILGMSVIGVIGYYTQKNYVMNSINESAYSQINEVQVLIDDRKESVQITEQAIDKYLIMVTKAIVQQVENTDEFELNNKIDNLVRVLNIPEIHVINENGLIQWSNIREFIGFDFNSSEQTKPFLKGLENRNFVLAQAPQERGVDKELFKYVGVARTNESGIVQIGVHPEELQTLINKIDIATLARTKNYGKNGYVYILDLDGVVLSHPDPTVLGTNIDVFDWGKKLVEMQTGSLTFLYGGEQRLNHFEKYGNYIIGTSLPSSEYQESLDVLRNKTILTILITVLLASLIILLNTRSLVRPLKKATEFAKSVAEGNLQIDPLENKSNDEIGNLSRSLNGMLKSLQSIIGQVVNIASQVAASSEELSASGEQVGEVAEQVGHSIQGIAAGAEEQSAQVEETNINVSNLSSAIKKVDTNTNELTRGATELSDKLEQGTKSVKVSVTNINEMKNNTLEVSQTINSLGEVSEEIGQIVELISGIADQTNLLALNAAIEAARAGEAGRGFSVVADEIRELAEESANATNNINNLIKQIQSSSFEAVKQMNNNVELVAISVESIDSTGSIFNMIEEHTLNLKNKLINISDNVSDMNNYSNNVEGTVASISSVSQEFASNSEEVAASSEEQIAATEEIITSAKQLAEMAQELSQTVDQFKI